MKKYGLTCLVALFIFNSVYALTDKELVLLICGRREEKRFNSLADYKSELKQHGLDGLEQECIAGKQKSCFVLEKLLEKELQDFFDVAKTMGVLEKERKKNLIVKGIPYYLDKYTPGITENIRAYIIMMRQKELEKKQKAAMKKLTKMGCKSTDDKAGLDQYLECRLKTLQKKYERRKECYRTMNRFYFWLYYSPYYPSHEKMWSDDIRMKMRLCRHYGHSQSCIELQKMRKK